jgi:UDP-N-acetylglucosamine--N-acetylmuramyl-(pentapeptide) pyrophosphoryl-undecaprenol N-acetylglucosamine transferase
MEKYFPADKIVLCGNPVRKDILDLTGKKQEAAKFFRLDPDRKTLLITGGSLGARTLNESTQKHIDVLVESGLQLIWQCGKSYYPLISPRIPELENKGIRIMEFISRMDLAYAMADMVVSRAGAIALAELCITGKPAILIPSPNVAEDHQTHNAMALVRNEAAVLLNDAEAKEKFGTMVLEVINDESKSRKLSENIKKMAFINSAEKIANEVLAAAGSKLNKI